MSTQDEKLLELERMYEAVANSEPAVFAIMDYWTFDGYLEFRRFVKQKHPGLSKLVLPGIELRVEAPVNYRLHLQVVLSDHLSDQQLSDFKTHLLIRAVNRNVSVEALQEFARTLDASKAKVHGFGPPDALSARDLLSLGCMTAEVTQESLGQAMKSVPPTDAYIIMPWDTSGGLEKLDWEKQPHADGYLMKQADIFESRTAKNADLFLGVVTQDNEHFIANFQKTLGDKPRPVICGSDAHRYDDYGVFPGGRATWVKANPSFEGLKQIVFEPRDRVRIQEESPAKKIPYLIIDKVAFHDSSKQPRFGTAEIMLNPDMNAIIGGKSSGKSLLLYHIAKSVDPQQVSEKLQLLGEGGYDLELDPNFDFEVTWGDGARTRLRTAVGDTSRRITYVPQMYINHLAEQGGEQHLKQLIESVLDQNDEYRKYRLQQGELIAARSAAIALHVQELYALRDAHVQLRTALRDLGDTTAIQEQIRGIQQKLEDLRKSSGFTPEENLQYAALVKRRDHDEARAIRYEAILAALNTLCEATTATLLDDALREVEEAQAAGDRYVGEDRVGAWLLRTLALRKREMLERLGEEYAQLDGTAHTAVQRKVARHRDALQQTSSQLAPFLTKVKNQQFMKELQTQLLKENEKLLKIAETRKRLADVDDRGKATRTALLSSYAELHAAYLALAAKLATGPLSALGNDLRLEVTVDFSASRFSENYLTLFDRRSNFRELFGDFFLENQFVYAPSTHCETVASIFDTISSKSESASAKLRTGNTLRDAAAKLFGDYFELRYAISQRGTNMLKMSPGKRGLVLLELILHISNAEHPVLIDQPEDNLDNRTIYNELNEFVKSKKEQRQIIFVTHNANLVVATDAENIIIANQSGQDLGKDNRQFGFEYVSSGLECTFRDATASGILYQMGVREHVCDILEGGEDAFTKRERKYGFRK
jgi:predicted ATP-dependent endonuclease of OLD family